MNEENLFHQALATPAGERAAFLDEACGGDSDLRRRVEILLRAHDNPGSFLKLPPAAPRAWLATRTPTVVERLIPECPGTLVGPYKLMEQIGEGGMGLVFVAEQQQPVRRKVAIKVIKPGMDTRQVVARFEAERQALALMDHPHIAKVLDGGETASGHPYFVMELVKGTPITDYCDQHQLSVRERLELFLQVCLAVQHAHQKGIIHRDIKPSNVLVTSHDGKPMVRVIDFGVAKAMGQQLTDKTVYTEFAQLIGTPLYMSPEQAGLSSLDIDTRSDIYSLSVLLYELLTGTTPFEKERFRTVGYDEMRRIIREEEPRKPSTRISTLGQAATTISAQRQSDPKRLCRLCRGELDWIVMKALDKDRNRRYETASAFAADVQCYLADEPVQACPPSAWYRFRKFARRNKVGLSMAGLGLLVLIALLGGLAVNNWLIRQEQQRTDEARQDEIRRRQQLRQALDAMSSQVIDDWLGKQQEPSPEHKQFLRQALAWYEELAADTAEDAASRSGAAGAHYWVGMIQWRLGQYQEAEAANRRAVELYEKLAADFPDEPEYRKSLARSETQFGRLLWLTAQPEKAEMAYNDVLAIQRSLAAQFPANPDYRKDLAYTHHTVAKLLQQTSRLAAAEAACQEALALQQQLLAEFPTRAEYRQALARSHILRGEVQRTLGRSQKAEEDFRAAVTLLELLGREFPNVASYREELAQGYQGLGNLLRFTSKPREAADHYGAGIATFQQLSAAFPALPRYRNGLARAQHNLGELLRTTGAPKKAEAAFGAALDVSRPLADAFPSVHSYRFLVASDLNGLGMARHASGELLKAEADYRAALDVLRQLTKALPKVVEYQRVQGQILNNLGALLAASNRPKDAQAAYCEAITAHENLVAAEPGVPDHESELSSTLGNLAIFFGRQKDWTSARPLLEQAIVHQHRALQSNPRNPDYLKRLRGQYDLLGDLLVQLGDHAAAATIAQEWSRAFTGDAAQGYDIAGLLARCVPLAEKDTRLSVARRTELSQAYGDQAVGLLRRALAGGAKNLEQLQTDSSLDPLRGREDFQQLLREVATKGK